MLKEKALGSFGVTDEGPTTATANNNNIRASAGSFGSVSWQEKAARQQRKLEKLKAQLDREKKDKDELRRLVRQREKEVKSLEDQLAPFFFSLGGRRDDGGDHDDHGDDGSVDVDNDQQQHHRSSTGSFIIKGDDSSAVGGGRSAGGGHALTPLVDYWIRHADDSVRLWWGVVGVAVVVLLFQMTMMAQ